MLLLKTISTMYRRDEVWIHDLYHPILKNAYYVSQNNEGQIETCEWLQRIPVDEWFESLKIQEAVLTDELIKSYSKYRKNHDTHTCNHQ